MPRYSHDKINADSGRRLVNKGANAQKEHARNHNNKKDLDQLPWITIFNSTCLFLHTEDMIKIHLLLCSHTHINEFTC